MKKCPYCAKEVGLHELYCSDECQKSVNDFHDKRDKAQKAFSIINGFFVLGIGISIFLYSFMPAAAYFGAACLIILGIMYLFLPFPADIMIEKYKLKKAIFFTRIIAGVLLLLGVIVALLKVFSIL